MLTPPGPPAFCCSQQQGMSTALLLNSCAPALGAATSHSKRTHLLHSGG